MQERHNSSALAMELCLSCINSSICSCGIEYQGLTGACLPQGMISTMCAIPVLGNGRKCRSILNFYEINSGLKLWPVMPYGVICLGQYCSNLNWNTNIFFQQQAFKYVVCSLTAILFRPQCVNSSWPSDSIWQHRFGPILMSSLMASSSYLNQCWPISIKVRWHS